MEIVVLAASAGALPAFRQVLSGLPRGFPSAVIAVRHRRAGGLTSLVDLLQPHTTLPVGWARAGGRPCGGRVYVVPDGRDLVLGNDGGFAFEPGTFPFRGISPLIASVAAWSGPRATAVVLTGTGADGARGSLALNHAGGTVIVQSGDSVEFIGMGHATIALGAAHLVMPLHDIAAALVRLASSRVSDRGFDGAAHVPNENRY